MGSERTAHGHYKKSINDVWYALAFDEDICLAIYALPFDTDKTARLTHLRNARRSLGKVIALIEASKATSAKKDYDANVVLVQ